MRDDTFVQAERWKRDLTIQQAYWLRERLDQCRSEDERDAVIQEQAEAAGLPVYKVRDMARWTEYLRKQDLIDAFARESIAASEWLERLTAGHLEALKDIKDQKTFRLPTSRERAAILVEAYHANWGVHELKAALVERNLLPVPKGMPIKPMPAGTLTIGQILVAMGQEMIRSGYDANADLLHMDLCRPHVVFNLLWRIQATYGKIYPQRMFTARPAEQTAPGMGKEAR